MKDSNKMAKKKETGKEQKEGKKGIKVEKAAKVSAKEDVKCNDKKCPVHANLRVRGRSFEGDVVTKREKTVKIEWIRFKHYPKFERYAKVKSALFAHLPECMQNEIEVGDRIKVTECRPLSRTKHFVVIGKV